VAASYLTDLRAGRILTSAEKAARTADEAAFATGHEVLRSAFAISGQHVLTAWHCVRGDTRESSPLWFRARRDRPGNPVYAYIPVRVSNYDETFDVAALAIDRQRLSEADLTLAQAAAFLSEVRIPLSAGVTLHEQLRQPDRQKATGPGPPGHSPTAELRGATGAADVKFSHCGDFRFISAWPESGRRPMIFIGPGGGEYAKYRLIRPQRQYLGQRQSSSLRTRAGRLSLRPRAWPSAW
jgi:hypothetical protein